jgi:glycosyltransferase involved in cell wall biosynthesis
MKVNRLSIVIPCYNEADNIPLLFQKLVVALSAIENTKGTRSEVILINDGSHDGTLTHLKKCAESDSRFRVIDLRKNYGQTAAMAAGFENSTGDVVIPMDADLQNDPDDIALLLDRVEEGFDVVSGWRRDRQDSWLTRKIPSRIANTLISLISGVRLRDYGCTLKAYRKEILRHVRLYGEMHRFIPIYASWVGARITEMPVRHHPRQFGKSKYGMIRTFKVLLDLLTIKFLGDYSTKPIYWFGGIGFLLMSVGLLCEVQVAYVKFGIGEKVYDNPMLIIGIFFMVIGFQAILIGLIAELSIRTYHESQGKPIYWIKEIYPPPTVSIA